MVTKKDNFGDRPNDFISDSGSREKDLYHGRLNKDTGEVELVYDGKQDWYGYIQSFKESVDINKIVERFQNGEIDILNQVQVMYGDVSKMPKSLGEAYRQIEEARYQFDRLPVNIKESFDNDFNKYIVEFGSDIWLSKVIPNGQEKESEVSKSDES